MGYSIQMNPKHCTQCKLDFPRTSDYFYKNSSSKDGLYSRCKKCKTEYKKHWRATRGKELIQERKQKLRKLKESCPCSDCGKMYPYYVMDFDHRKGTDKVCNISQMIGQKYSISALEKEIDKCDLVCSNCHRERTHSGKFTHG